MIRMVSNMNLSKKLLVAPLVIILFLLLLGWVSNRGLFSQKAAMEDVYNNRFKKYQTSATVVKDMANVHASLYKVISWANAEYDDKKIDQLGKDQLGTMERTLAEVGNALKSEGLTQEEKNSTRPF
jgi:phosphoglycerate-specific signal transduction histidine kinase